MPNHEFSDKEVQEILQRASEIDGGRDYSDAVLEQTAAELGISSEAVERAKKEYLLASESRAEIQEFRRHRIGAFQRHFASYVVTNLFMIGIWYMTGARYPWFIWVILGWGVGVATNAISAYSSSGSEFEAEFEAWRKDRKLKRP